ncbi:unnamed protein product [Cuscuta europaea]|uniref:Peptidase A1 domain-containing protein n=1 Tax=Cuscuta europaea TaxID=41803 RepID=A0A9P0YW65_CUSEU|nr:unnamed protein product [Cuscuta europaea]
MAYKSGSLINLSMLLVSYTIFLLSIESTNGFTVDLIHPDSPLNPFRDPSKTRFESIIEASNHSHSRAAAGASKFKTPTKASTGGYVMKYSIGTPPFETYGFIDTGSDLTWTQCKSCEVCFDQSLPMFDPTKSQTYVAQPCNSAACKLTVGDAQTCTEHNTCEYKVSYNDDSATAGDVATDVVSFGDGATFKNVVFGCGHENSGDFSEDTSGIVGLGLGPSSIVQQLAQSIGGKFAYCFSSDPNGWSHISFGPEAAVKEIYTVVTPFSREGDDFYWVTLNSVSVYGEDSKKVVKFSGASTQRKGNIIIDSGTTLTYLPGDMYNNLESEVKEAIPLTPADPMSPFKLCYNSGSTFKVPNIVANFAGGDVFIKDGAFVKVTKGVFCLTLVPAEDDNYTYGNMAQLNYIVGYDLGANTVSFTPSDCSKN